MICSGESRGGRSEEKDDKLMEKQWKAGEGDW
jgi:hypothetical protein